MDPRNRNFQPIGMLNNKVENVIENKPEQVVNDPVMSKEAKQEATQVLDTKPNNDEANNQQVEKATNRLSDDFETVDDLMSYLENEYGQQTDTSVDTNNTAVNSTEQSSEGKTESVGEADKESEVGKDQNAKVLEDFIEANPEEAAKEFKGTEVAKEANQILDDTDVRNDEVNDEEIGKFLEKNKGLIDWDKVKVYEPGEDPLYKVSDEADWKNNPTYHPDEGIIADETIDEIVNNPDVVDYGLEDQNQYQEGVDPSLDETVYDKTMAETAPISDDKLEPAPEAPLANNVVQIKEDPIDEVVDEVVENDETQQETDNDFKLPNLVGGHGAGLSSLGSAPVSKTDLGSNMFKVAGGSFGRMFQNLHAPSGSIPGLGPVGSTSTPVSAWNSPKSNAGGGAKVAGIKSDASRAVASHASKGISTFTSNGTYKSTALPESRKGTSISVRNVGPKYGTGTKATASIKLEASKGEQPADISKMILAASKTWNDPKDSGTLYTPYRVLIEGDEIYVNQNLLQNCSASTVQDLTNKINGVA